MSTDQAPKAPGMDLSTLNELNSTAVAYWLRVLTGGLVLTVWWFTRGPDHPAVALIVAVWTFEEDWYAGSWHASACDGEQARGARLLLAWTAPAFGQGG